LDILNSAKPTAQVEEVKVEPPAATTLVADHIQSSPFLEAINQLAPASGLSDQALQAISSNDFKAATQELTERVNKYPRQDNNKLLLAICQLGAGKARQSMQQLIPLVEENSRYEQQAAWYLALAYFQEGMPIQAFGLLEMIANDPDNRFQQEAQAFLKKLRG